VTEGRTGLEFAGGVDTAKKNSNIKREFHLKRLSFKSKRGERSQERDGWGGVKTLGLKGKRSGNQVSTEHY